MDTKDVLSVRYKGDPYQTLVDCVAAGPIIPGKIPILGKMGFVTTYAAVQDMLKDSDRFAVDGRNAGRKTQVGVPWLPQTIRVLAQNMLTLDDPDHRRLRKLVDHPFRTAAIASLEPAIERLADRLLDEMEAAGETDLVSGFCQPLPLLVICELLGMPEEDRPSFTRWMAGFGNVGSLRGVLGVLPALNKMMAYLRKEVARVRVDPKPGLISELAHAEADGDRLSEEEMLAMIFVLFVAGHETTTHLFSTSVITLLERPDDLAALKADAGLWPGAIEELLRYNSPVQLTKPRFARADMDFHGVPLKRGERLMALLAAANMDSAQFDQPFVFDIRREKNRHLGFGGGMHLCLGLQLARAEARIGLTRLFERWPDLALAVPFDELKWLKRSGMRGVDTLPVTYSVPARAAMTALAQA